MVGAVAGHDMGNSSTDNRAFTNGHAPRTVLFPGCSISGKLSYNLAVKIDSRFSGEVESTDLLVFGRNAEVEARIYARHLQLEGKLEGRVQVTGCFEILPGGFFRGEFKAGQLRLHPGAVFEGKGEIAVKPREEVAEAAPAPQSRGESRADIHAQISD
jgi:cytoskeletal protein CcmA (bactofilin family)